jgi:hypothetical protein
LTQVEETLPTLRDLYHLWIRHCAPACAVHYYDSPEEVPLHELDSQQRLWLQFTGVNLQVASQPWSFEARTLDDLAIRGLAIAPATLQTLAVCRHGNLSSSKGRAGRGFVLRRCIRKADEAWDEAALTE